MGVHKVKGFLIGLIFTSVAFTMSGCASMFGSDNRSIHVTSNPDNAKVYYQGVEIGKTPTNVAVDSTFSPGSITVKKPGYNTSMHQIQTSFQTVGILNIFFWPGFIIDAITGKMMKVSNHHIHLPLSKEV